MTPPQDYSVAAIVCPKGGGADELLLNVARRVQAGGALVCGNIQRNLPDAAQVCSIMHVENIATGALHNITQNLGAGSTGCRLDPAALAEVAEQLLAALESPVDLLILNRFGKGEAEGHGLRAVIEKAFIAGVRVLTVVRPEYVPDFQAFTGGTAQMLAPRLEDAMHWAERGAFTARNQCGAA